MEPADCFFGIPQWICIKIKKIIFWTVQSKMGEGGEDKKSVQNMIVPIGDYVPLAG